MLGHCRIATTPSNPRYTAPTIQPDTHVDTETDRHTPVFVDDQNTLSGQTTFEPTATTMNLDRARVLAQSSSPEPKMTSLPTTPAAVNAIEATACVEQKYVSHHEIRSEFVTRLSEMYRKEVPRHGEVLEHVVKINREVTGKTSAPREEMAVTHHGAIRLGTPKELEGVGRLFRVMGMFPVNYYNLATVNLPIHSTAFRPISEESLSKNAFRMFVSLLRPELVSEQCRPMVLETLAKRQIFSDDLMQMIALSEQQGGLTKEQTEVFLSEAVNVFKRHEQATVSLQTYTQLRQENMVLADIVSFETPHVNHFALKTESKLNGRGLIEGEPGIDIFQHTLKEAGIEMIPAIQGAPKREVPILLRQTSSIAQAEKFVFPGEGGKLENGTHSARFCELETKGDAALTPAGRALYDRLLTSVLSQTNEKQPGYVKVLTEAFKEFPDDPDVLRAQGLIYVKYRPTEQGLELARQGKLNNDMSMDQLLEKGCVTFDWVPYEDFLPISAAGIFKSNLKGTELTEVQDKGDRKAEFESALKQPILDSFSLYAEIEAHSQQETRKALGIE